MKNPLRFPSRFLHPIRSAITMALLWAAAAGAAGETGLKSLAVDGALAPGQGQLVIRANLQASEATNEPPLHATAIQSRLRVGPGGVDQFISLVLTFPQGEPEEVVLDLAGDGEVREVKGEGLQAWSVRRDAAGRRQLVLRLPGSGRKPALFSAMLVSHSPLDKPPATITPTALQPTQPTLAHGYLRIDVEPGYGIDPLRTTGLAPMDPAALPEPLRPVAGRSKQPPLAYRFQGAPYELTFRVSLQDPGAAGIRMSAVELTGRLAPGRASFTLTGRASARNRQGGETPLLLGNLALTKVDLPPNARLDYDSGCYRLRTDRAGDFPIRLEFDATVRETNGWRVVDFEVVPAPVQPLRLEGVDAGTEFELAGAAQPERHGTDFSAFLPPNGRVGLSWRSGRSETEGRLFYSAEALEQITVGAGLLRQSSLITIKVMQGELAELNLRLKGEGEVTRVSGASVLAWKVEPAADGGRQLAVRLNQAQKDSFQLQVQTQTPLGAFPQQTAGLHVWPVDTVRFGGYLRIVNDGAVRLEILRAPGLSQVSPDQFPENDLTRAELAHRGTQQFVYRFSGSERQLQIQADDILPELGVSEILMYRLADTELAIEAEIELDIREAPLREAVLRLPKAYALTRITAQGMNDYFLGDTPDKDVAELRLVYGTPVSGRQLIQLRLEHNQPWEGARWDLPRVEVTKARSTRGQIAIAAEAGFRVTSAATDGLTDVATAFFPRKLPGIQAAFRLSDPAWRAAMNVERLAHTIQVDALHLFSIGEGIAYGSSVLNFAVSGAPVTAFRIELSPEYFNVEFSGKEVRGWQKTNNVYLVQLHAPVTGIYTLLATYERPFKAQGDTLAFSGARPLDAQTEQGHTLIISTYQFQVQPKDLSPGLLPLETAEVPAEYRLFFDAPILAAYRYTARPFNLELALRPLAQGETVSQVVDRAAILTRISREGQAVTDARYVVKSKGKPTFRVTLPPDTQLWTATVNGTTVVPVSDKGDNLIPLPQVSDPGALQVIELRLASRSDQPRRLALGAPIVDAPVLLADWRLEPDTGQRLVYRNGTLTPVGGMTDPSAFSLLARFIQTQGAGGLARLISAFALAFLSGALWRYTLHDTTLRFHPRHLAGLVVGAAAALVAGVIFAGIHHDASLLASATPSDIRLLAPVQAARTPMLVEVANLPIGLSPTSWLGWLWPALVGLGAWIAAGRSKSPRLNLALQFLGWIFLFWAALRWPQSTVAVLAVAIGFFLIELAWPTFKQWRQLPASPPAPAPTPTALLIGSMLVGLAFNGSNAQAQAPFPAANPIAQQAAHEIRVEKNFGTASLTLRWQATKDQRLPILREPGILTHLEYPTGAVELVRTELHGRLVNQLLARKPGDYTIVMRYQVPVTERDGAPGLALPTATALVNAIDLTVAGSDLSVDSSAAVTVSPVAANNPKQSRARLVLRPGEDSWISWRPRARDTRRETAVFYAELSQVFVPSAGIIEGLHQVQIRPAQGALDELRFQVPAGLTITDVVDTTQPNPGLQVSSWRFDPDQRTLRVALDPAQDHPFALLVRSQVAASPLPLDQPVGILSVTGAAGQVGLVGVASSSEVQVDDAHGDAFTAVNLEDFPAAMLAPLARSQPDLTLRRAFRHSDFAGTLAVKASAVEPDVRVESQQTLSLGEDRVLLAADLGVEITRAGIFRLSFILPKDLDVESVSGEALSHWTEVKTPEGRLVTFNLRGKTIGRVRFNLNLTGPGLRRLTHWSVPRLALREATKQQGQLLVVPEQGLRPQAAAREGVAQLDPQKAGVRQKGVLAFRLIRADWSLDLDLEQVEPWIQVTSLQDVTLTEAQARTTATLQYQIENTGVKGFVVRLPADAENVRFQGEQVADFVAREGAPTDGLRDWDVKLHRRFLGRYSLQVSYQQLLADQAPSTSIAGVEARDVSLQRGFVTLRSGGRLNARVDETPAALQPADWQSIPRSLQPEASATAANHTYRLVEPGFRLPVILERREAVRLLPARVNRATLTSVIADDSAMLTRVQLELVPGDKRLLHLRLPTDSRFWFAFVNQNGVWPWISTNEILVPLEQHSRIGDNTAVEIYYSSPSRGRERGQLDLQLPGPTFDLPLENITWRVYLNDKWQLTHWSGPLQFQGESPAPQPGPVDLEGYVRKESALNAEQTREAAQMLSMANTLLQQGDPQQARRAFQAAYGLSQHDSAFNEDARVQLHTLRLEQALVGLNVRQANVAGTNNALAEKWRDTRTGRNLGYTPSEAKQLLEQNSAEESGAQARLAERLIQQQDAVTAPPGAVRASIPEQGRLLTFGRALQVDPWSSLSLHLQARPAASAPPWMKLLILGGVSLSLLLLVRLARGRLLPRPQR